MQEPGRQITQFEAAMIYLGRERNEIKMDVEKVKFYNNWMGFRKPKSVFQWLRNFFKKG
jgi:hypothetical protein